MLWRTLSVTNKLTDVPEQVFRGIIKIWSTDDACA